MAENFKPVQVELVSSRSQTTENDNFKIGVQFKIEPGWHIYGETTGDLGLPTKIDFSSDAELKFSPLHWPKTIKFLQAGGLEGDGYEHQALIWSDVEVRKAVANKNVVKILARIKWLACGERVCVPEKATLEIDIPLGTSAVEATSNKFSIQK